MPDQVNPLKPQRVLLIERSAYIREALKEALRPHGIDLHCVETGEEGIQIIGRYRFTAVVCNYHLPGINGLEFFWKMKEQFSRSVTILTASSADDYIANAARESGVDFFMEMPFKIEDLIIRLGGRKPVPDRSSDEFGFLSNVQNYSIAFQMRQHDASRSAARRLSADARLRISRVTGKSGRTFKVFHNGSKFRRNISLRPKLKLITPQNRNPA